MLGALANQLLTSAGSTANKSVASKGTLSERLPLRHLASGQASPMGEVADIVTTYNGPKNLCMALQGKRARALSLAAADFDEDGVPDVASGYGYSRRGIITIQCGNGDSIYPNSPEAARHKAEGTFTELPFRPSARVFEVPESADFISAGDFDADGHCDIVVAASAGDKLYLLTGDGLGGFAPAKALNLPGKVTAMAVGEMNRPDGLEDLIVATESRSGSSVLVFEGPEGALRATPEVVDLPARATSLALGQLDDSYEIDLAIAAGHELIVVDGRDRKSSLDEKKRAEVKPAAIHRRAFSFELQAVAVGDFIGNQTPALAVLSKDGEVHLLSRPHESGLQIDEWPSDIRVNRVWNECSHLVSARMSGATADDLVVVDTKSRHLHLLMRDAATASQSSNRSAEESARYTVPETLDMDAGPVAALSLRLNPDALDDLVMLDATQNRLVAAMTKPQAVMTVTNTDDSGPGSLRQAILDANNRNGTDTINFRIAGAGVKTINLKTALPVITGPVTIDGTSQPGFAGSPVIALRGGGGDSTITIMGGRTTVRGLDICSPFIGFGPYDIEIVNAGGNHIEGNFISEAGIAIRSANNVVGGTTTNARNTFALHATAIGVLVSGGAATNNTILGNLFAPPASTCKIALPPCGGTGLWIEKANSNTIGGTTSGARNVFSGSIESQNIKISGATGNLIQGNYIGTDSSGSITSVGFAGIALFGAPNTTVGGTTPNARNIISGHLGPGIAISSDPNISNGIQIQGNYIGTDVTGSHALGNGSGITVFTSPGTTIGGATASARNIISGNQLDGIGIGVSPVIPCVLLRVDPGGSDYTIQQNYIGTDVSGTQSLGNGDNGILVLSGTFSHEINSNRIAFNEDGIKVTEILEGLNTRSGFSIRMISNAIFSNRRLGIELGDNGVIANDPRDVDTGANERQNFPVLSAFTPTSKVSTDGDFTAKAINSINFTFNSTPLQTFTLEFFFGSACSGSGAQLIGSIPIPLGTRQVTTDANGNATATFTFSFPSSAASGWVNATATNSAGNTSEFSECRQVINASLPILTIVAKQGKKLFVSGSNFEEGAKLLLNGEPQKTLFDSAILIIGKKAGKIVKSGDKIKVRNPEGIESAEITFP